MFSRPHTSSMVDTQLRKSIEDTNKPRLARKRKAATFSETHRPGGTLNTEYSPSDQNFISRASAGSSYDYYEERYDFEAILTPRKKSKQSKPFEERRLRSFRKHAPQSYLERLERARSQRMFLIDRSGVCSADGGHEEEIFDIAGTTGNVYQVKISKIPSCTCPDAQKGNQCKHIIHVLVNVLKAPEHLAYQLAFFSSELSAIFAQAPVIPQSVQEADCFRFPTNNRKALEGECPICMTEFEAETDETVWCRAACGNNIHKQCFEQWASSKFGQVKCVYCRTPWKGDEECVKRISKMGKLNEEGYINIASELGISIQRDHSSYHRPWFRG